MATDDNGNEIGRIYEARFEMPVQFDVWTRGGDQYDPNDIAESVRFALYRYDNQQRGDPLPDPESPTQPLSGITRFTLSDTSPQNDLSMTPALRRWRQTGEVWFTERVNTAVEYGPQPYVANVVAPSDGNMASDGTYIEFDATAGTESAADRNN
jgi:hypothetical protein